MSIYDIFILLGGVGLFLYGMTIMSSGLKNACGDNLKVILGKATKNKVTSILAGIAVTIFCYFPMVMLFYSIVEIS